jgi:hypothetical protein
MSQAGCDCLACAGEGPQALLVLDNVVRIRAACAHNDPGLVTGLSSLIYRQAGNYGSSKNGQQVPPAAELLPKYSFRGKTYYGERWVVVP